MAAKFPARSRGFLPSAAPSRLPASSAPTPYRRHTPHPGCCRRSSSRTWRWRTYFTASASSFSGVSSRSGLLPASRTLLMEFVEAQGSSSYRCSPSSPYIRCQYSEKGSSSSDKVGSCRENYFIEVSEAELQNFDSSEIEEEDYYVDDEDEGCYDYED